MGFHRRYIPEIEVLKKLRENYKSDEEFVRHFTNKADAIIGSSESISYLEELAKKIQEKKDSDGDRI